jgi:hypothetical protein
VIGSEQGDDLSRSPLQAIGILYCDMKLVRVSLVRFLC